MFNTMINSSLKEVIREESKEAERIGKLSPRQLAIIYENKWFHLLVPKEFGGKEMDLPEFALFMEELASIDGSFAWNVNLGAGANMFAGYLDKKIAQDIFSNPEACIAGSGAISGIAKKEKDHYSIKGYWKYASGSAHANFFSLNAVLVDDEKEGAFSSFIVPRNAVEILDTWKTTGLKATASHDFKIEGFDISERYAFDLLKPSQNCTGVLYRFPFQLLAEINMLVMSLGLAKHFLELAKQIALHKIIKEKEISIAELPPFKKLIEKRESEFLEVREKVFEAIHLLWDKCFAGDLVLLQEQESFTQLVLQSADQSRQLVDALYPFMGMDTVFESSEINRVWRDFKVASQHALISPIRIIK